MRDVAVTEGDKVEAELRFGVSVNTYGVNDLVDAVDAVADADVDDLVAEYEDAYDVAPELRPAASGTSRCATAPASSSGCATSSTAGGFGAFTTNFEDLGGLRQLPGLAVQRLMADGYGFGGEGDWKTAVCCARSRRWRRDCPAAPRSWRTTPTTSAPGQPKILGAHMLEVCPTIAGQAALEIHPLGIGGREDPVRLVFDAAPVPAVVVGLADLGDRFRLVANEVDVVDPDEPLPSCRSPAPCGAAPTCATSAESWLTAGGPHHTVLSTAVGTEELDDLAEMLRHRAGRHRRRHHPRAGSPTSCAGTRPTPPAPPLAEGRPRARPPAARPPAPLGHPAPPGPGGRPGPDPPPGGGSSERRAARPRGGAGARARRWPPP